ncbi:MAG: hypothetical protein LQ350_003713 [Teloschistes chrysophthalmus]|nr:MAG: hypothetical protein LQ350_003713 [Niorma chrysophthalma]
MDNTNKEPSFEEGHHQKVPEFPIPDRKGFTNHTENDEWWSEIFSSPHAEQGEAETAAFLNNLVFYRVRNGLLQPIKDVLNAQLDQPGSLNDLAITALRIQRQLPTPRPSVSIADRGSVLQNMAPPRVIMQQGGRTPSAQAGREEVRESPRQTHRSKKRKSLQGYDEADLEEALLQKRRAGNSREEQISSSMLGQVARGKSPQVYPDSLGGGSVERQRCRREDDVHHSNEVQSAFSGLAAPPAISGHTADMLERLDRTANKAVANFEASDPVLA